MQTGNSATDIISNATLRQQIEKLIDERVGIQLQQHIEPLREEAERAKTANAQLQQEMELMKTQTTANTEAVTTNNINITQMGITQQTLVDSGKETQRLLLGLYTMMQQQQPQQNHHGEPHPANQDERK